MVITKYNASVFSRSSQEDNVEPFAVLSSEKHHFHMATIGTHNDSMTENCRVVEFATEERNRVTADLDIDSHPGLNPILGYAKVPLLPLVKACAPLNHIIHDLPAYVQLALYETPKIPPNGLTVDESASIRLYTIEWNKPHRSLYSMLNYALKTDDREDLQPYFRFLKLFLTALAKLPCVPHSRPYGEE